MKNFWGKFCERFNQPNIKPPIWPDEYKEMRKSRDLSCPYGTHKPPIVPPPRNSVSKKAPDLLDQLEEAKLVIGQLEEENQKFSTLLAACVLVYGPIDKNNQTQEEFAKIVADKIISGVAEKMAQYEKELINGNPTREEEPVGLLNSNLVHGSYDDVISAARRSYTQRGNAVGEKYK